MKHIKFWSIGMPCILLASVMLYVASCSSDEPPAPVPKEVVDEWVDTNVTSKPLPGSSGTSSAGTEFSYKSRITLQKDASGGASYAPARGPKNASSNDDVEIITVTLKDVFHNLDTAIVVRSFDFGQPTSTITYTTNGRRSEGYVTITDSVMHYNVNFDGFSFWYTLEYEVAVYDDGVNHIIMPYHKIKNLRDNGFSVEDMEFVLEPNSSGGKDVYLRKKIKHSITVEFNGEDYTLYGNVILKKHVGTHPCIVGSELIDKGVSDVNSSDIHTTYTTWANVMHRYSDNSTKIRKYDVEMWGDLGSSLHDAVELSSSDLTLSSIEIKDTGEEREVYSSGIVSVHEIARELVVTYNQFSSKYSLSECRASYDDGFIAFDFSCIEHSGANVDFSLHEYDRDDSWIYYLFRSRTEIKFGDVYHVCREEFNAYLKR